MSPTPSSDRTRAAAASSALSRSGFVVKSRYGATNVKSDAMADEHGGAREPPAVAEPACEAHDDEQRDADRQELRRRGAPSPRRASRDSSSSLCSLRRVHQCAANPNGRWTSHTMPETEHPEEHPGADRPGRRLAREARASRRVEPEREQQRDLRENPERRRRPARSASPRATKSAPKTASTSIGREREIVRNRGRIEEERPDRERRDDERGESGSQKASPRTARCRRPSSSDGLASRAGSGAPYGYRLVTSRAYAYVCAE